MFCGLTGLKNFVYADLYEMFYLSIICGVFATILRTFVMIYILDPLAVYAVNDSKVAKFQQSAWRCILYFFTSVASIIVYFTSSTISFSISSFFEDWPVYEPEAGIKFMYALYAGFYLHQSIYLLTDVRLDDFNEHVVHHAVTLLLVFVSWAFHFTKIGFFIMTLHDGSDVFLEFAKCMNYVKEIRPNMSILSDISFLIFSTSFFYLRLYVYPVHAIGSVINPHDACAHVSCASIEGGASLSYCASKPIYSVALFTLTSLYVLQCMWAVRIVNVIVKVLRGHPLEDSRE